MSRNLYCIASGHEGAWEAFCLDFDLAVQGRSFDEVKEGIRQAIVDYVDSAMAEAEPAKSQLLGRRAPFWTRLLWALRVFRDTISTGAQHRDPAIGFPVACPA